MCQPPDPSAAAASPSSQGLREAARLALIELDAAQNELVKTTSRLNQEFHFAADEGLCQRIQKLRQQIRSLKQPTGRHLERLNRDAIQHANRFAIPNSQYWHREVDNYLAGKIRRSEQVLLALETRLQEDLAAAQSSFVTTGKRAEEARLAVAAIERARTSERVEQAFRDALDTNYLAAIEENFVDLADRELYAKLRATRRELVRSWVRDHLRGLQLDDEQADAVGVVGRHVKVTARAGSGKTRALTVRAAFLIAHCGVDAREILLLAFNRKAAREITARLESFGISCPQVLTFHALARAIVQPDERLITDEDGDPTRHGLVTQIIRQWVETDAGDQRVRDVMLRHYRADWIRIFGGFSPDRGAAIDLLRRSVSHETLDGKQVKSFGEQVIANFLFEHGVPYRYEPARRWGRNVYRPDFDIPKHRIVIEYFGRSQDPAYRQQMEEKRKYWRDQPGWQLLEYAPEQENGEIDKWLPRALERDLGRAGVPLRRLSVDEIWEARGRQLKLDFSRLLAQLIGRCRKTRLAPAEFADLVAMHKSVDSIEADVLEIAAEAYPAYLRNLMDTGQEDFDGLLVRAIEKVNGGSWEFGRRDLFGDIRALRYVMVDEFQDVAPLFWDLLEAIRNRVCGKLELLGVGDDWQAINGFAGSSTRFLSEFESRLKPSSSCALLTNYRSGSSVVGLGNLIMTGRGQPGRSAPGGPPGRTLLADIGSFTASHLEAHHWPLDTITPALRRLLAVPVSLRKSIAVLARQRFPPYAIASGRSGSGVNGPETVPDLNRLQCLVCEGLDDVARERITFDTVHAFKGREADFVVILDAVDKRFPKLHPNWIFGRVFGDSVEQLVEDERRLFYVGCSRAAHTLVLMTEGSRESQFIEPLRAKFENLDWRSLAPSCPRDGDWLMVLDSMQGFGIEPTMFRSEVLKQHGFEFVRGDRAGVWQKRIPGNFGDVGQLGQTIRERRWFEGPPGLRIRFMHGDGVVEAEYHIRKHSEAGKGLEVRLVPEDSNLR
jgi:DNA helicase-4